MRFNYSQKRELYYEKAMKLYFEEGMQETIYVRFFPSPVPFFINGLLSLWKKTRK